MANKTSTVKADDPKAGMTADEIVRALATAAPGSVPKVRVTWKGTIASIEFEEALKPITWADTRQIPPVERS